MTPLTHELLNGKYRTSAINLPLATKRREAQGTTQANLIAVPITKPYAAYSSATMTIAKK